MCGAVIGGLDVEGRDLTKETVIQGTVNFGGSEQLPAAGAYVRLLDATGEFTAEMPTSDDGGFRFFAAPGDWTLRVISGRARAERSVQAARGVTTVRVDLPPTY